MMTLANYGLKSNKHKDPNSAKSLSKSLQIRNRAELAMKQCLRTHYKLPYDKRNDIINSLDEYYARVPFNVVIWNKFQTKQCIVDSVLLLDSNFNPYKARQAFKAVEDMLINLIYLPWHEEFTKISTYSGRFRYVISSHLIGIEEVFKAAGFKPGPVDSIIDLVLPDDGLPQNDESQSVASVIFDCMLAQVILTDVISIFESCCKSLKQSLSDEDINCYSWIQAYFRERSHQITDKARSCIQELLNNISNHLTKQRITASKVSSSIKNELSPGPSESSSLRREFTDNADKIVAQHNQIRKYLSQKTSEDASTFKIADDLLKIPDKSDHSVAQRKQYITNTDDLRTNSGSNNMSASLRNQPLPRRENNHALSAPYRQQSTTMTRQGTRLDDSLDIVDSHFRTDSPRVASYELMNQAVRTDIPQNDREPLIPKPDRKFSALEGVQTIRCGPHQFYRSQIGCYPDTISQNALSSASRYQYNDHPMSSYETQTSSQQLQNMIKSSSSRYDGLLNKKYESRDMDRATFNSRLHWSCNSCTYNNHPTSEICEMCGKRRSS